MYGQNHFEFRRAIKRALREVCKTKDTTWLLSQKGYPSRHENEAREIAWALFWEIPDLERDRIMQIECANEENVELHAVVFVKDELLGIICQKFADMHPEKTIPEAAGEVS